MRKSFLLFSCLWLFIFNGVYSTVASASNVQAVFTLEKNNPDKTFSATITLKNNSKLAIENWQLAFSFIRSMTDIQEGTLSKHMGYYYIISPNNKTLQAHSQSVFHIKGKWFIKHVTDAPNGYFLILTHPGTHTQSTLALAGKTILPAKVLSQDHDEYAENIKRNNTSIEGNPVLPDITVNQSLIIPLPAQFKRTSGIFTLRNNTSILIESKNAASAAHFFVTSIQPATGYDLKLARHSINTTPKNTILFTQHGADSTLGQEGYILEISQNHIIIRANTDAGFFYAIQSLRQLFAPAIFSKRHQHLTWKIPCLTIRDYPRFAYRGFLLDTARHFMPPAVVKRLIDLMAIHKLNRFQWHLTDDEGWRVEIKHYPTLTSIGAWRGFQQVMPPELGTGAKRTGGFYSQTDIRDIVKYAQERHVTIIPEIDIPGHARAMLLSLPSLLMDQSDASHYTSAQGYHDNVLSPCLENTYTVINQIMTDVAALFPGDTIHVGSDEVPEGAWVGSSQCQKQMKLLGLKNKDALQAYFLNRVKKILETKNKKMAVWNDAIKDNSSDNLKGNSTIIYSWTSDDAGLQAAKLGYPVVLMPASHLYFDMTYNSDALEPGFYWAGSVDTFTIYAYQPIDSDTPDAITHKILGVQGALWSENVSSVRELDYFTFPKLLALSEVAWTPKTRRNWINFSSRVGMLHLQRLDYYGVAYRIPAAGINMLKLQQKILEANVEFPGLELRYSVDGKLPTSHSLLYRAPVRINDSTIRMRAFNHANRGGRSTDLDISSR